MAMRPGFRYARQPQRSAWTVWRRLGSPRLSRMHPDVRRQAKRMWRDSGVRPSDPPEEFVDYLGRIIVAAGKKRMPSMGGR